VILKKRAGEQRRIILPLAVISKSNHRGGIAK